MTLACKRNKSSCFLIVTAVFLCSCVTSILCCLLFFHSLPLHLLPSANTSTFHAQLPATVSLVSLKPAVLSSSHLTRTPRVTPPLSSSSTARQEWFSLQFNTTKKLLCHSFTGRLGNELFQYSATLGLALTLNRTPVFLNAKHIPSVCLLYTSPSPRDSTQSRMPSSA